jgi:hypothetical protein
MRSTILQIGDRIFPSKQAVRDTCKNILKVYGPGSKVSNPEHVEFLAGLLDLHENRDGKVGAGVRSFEVERTTYGNCCFWLTRVDGSRTDWSIERCLRPLRQGERATQAFRNAVISQVVAFKALQAFPMVCPFNGETLTADTCHIDHKVPFAALLVRFAAKEGLELEHVQTRAHLDGETHQELADEKLRERWQLFHRVNARLRIVSREANLSILRRSNP